MATTHTSFDRTGDGSDLTHDFSFKFYQTADIRVDITDANGNFKNVTNFTTAATGGSEPNYTSGTVTFNNSTTPDADVCESTGAPKNNRTIRIYRRTTVSSGSDGTALPKTNYTAGSPIRAADLDNNQKQLLYAVYEQQEQEIAGNRVRDSAITTSKIADSNVTTAKIANSAVTDAKIAGMASSKLTGALPALDGSNLTGVVLGDTTVTAAKLHGDLLVTAAEQASHTANDTSILTTAAGNARYYGLGSVEEIQSGETWAAADNKVATTAAIDARIIDLVDDVGGFVPIANETSFPNANPDVNNPATGGTIVSIKALASNLTSNGSGVATIANGNVANSATVTINGLANSTTYAAGIGMLVETTSTLHTYTFHRQSPDATSTTTVAGSITNVNTVATNISNVNTVAGVSSNVTTVAGISANTTTVAGVAANVTTVAGIASDVTAVAGDATDIGAVAGKATEIGRLGTADAVSDMNTLGTSANVTAMDNCSGSISNINTVSGSIANVNTVGSNISTVNDFAARYRVASSAPGSNNDEGDLYFNTTSNELQVYNGSAWQGGVTATGNLVSTAGSTMTGDLVMDNQSDIRFEEATANGSNYIALQAPAAIASNVTLTLPNADGSNGQLLKTDGSGNLGWVSDSATDSTKMPLAGGTFTGDVTLNGQNDLRFADGDSSHYVALQAPATVASNVTWTLPAADGSSGQTLSTDGSGALSWASSGSPDIVDDTSPQLGGNLDVQASEINTSTTNANIKLNPNGTGVLEVKGNTNPGTIQLNCENNSHGVKIKGPAHSAAASYTLTLPDTDGNANQVLKTDGSGALGWADQASGATGGSTDEVFVENARTVTASYTITSTKNAHTVGPISLNSGAVITVPVNSTWYVH